MSILTIYLLFTMVEIDGRTVGSTCCLYPLAFTGKQGISILGVGVKTSTLFFVSDRSHVR